MIGTMADILLKKKTYKDKLEQFLVNIVFPEFQSPHGHLRARACWMLHYFAGMKNKIKRVFFLSNVENLELNFFVFSLHICKTNYFLLRF